MSTTGISSEIPPVLSNTPPEAVFKLIHDPIIAKRLDIDMAEIDSRLKVEDEVSVPLAAALIRCVCVCFCLSARMNACSWVGGWVRFAKSVCECVLVLAQLSRWLPSVSSEGLIIITVDGLFFPESNTTLTPFICSTRTHE